MLSDLSANKKHSCNQDEDIRMAKVHVQIKSKKSFQKRTNFEVAIILFKQQIKKLTNKRTQRKQNMLYPRWKLPALRGILHKRYLGREIDTRSRKLAETIAGSSNIRK